MVALRDDHRAERVIDAQHLRRLAVDGDGPAFRIVDLAENEKPLGRRLDLVGLPVRRERHQLGTAAAGGARHHARQRIRHRLRHHGGAGIGERLQRIHLDVGPIGHRPARGKPGVAERPRVGDRLLVRVENDVLRVEHVVDRHAGERGLKALRVGLGGELLLLRLEHPLDQVLVAAEFGAVVAAHAAVEVARGGVAEGAAEVEHTEVVHRLQAGKAGGVEDALLALADAAVIGRTDAGDLALDGPLDGRIAAHAVGEDGLVGGRRRVGILVLDGADPALVGGLVAAVHRLHVGQRGHGEHRHGDLGRQRLLRLHRAQANDGQQTDDGQQHQPKAPPHVRAEDLEPLLQRAGGPELLDGPVRADVALEVEDERRRERKQQHQRHRHPGGDEQGPPPFDFPGQRIAEEEPDADGQHALDQHEHHLGVPELGKARHTVEEEVGQAGCVAPREHDGQQRHHQHRPAEHVAPQNERDHEERDEDGPEVEGAPAEELFAPV